MLKDWSERQKMKNVLEYEAVAIAHYIYEC